MVLRSALQGVMGLSSGRDASALYRQAARPFFHRYCLGSRRRTMVNRSVRKQEERHDGSRSS
jgi:hypothetical protein